jgi:hypothetical protein
VGPIAARLVDKAAGRAGSVGELYSLLAQHIDSDSERDRFLAFAPASGVTHAAPADGGAAPATKPESSIGSEQMESMAKLMTRYIGPIAPIVVKRESRGSQSLEELRERLAAIISDQSERAEFLRLARG